MSRRMQRMPAPADSPVSTPDLGDLMHVAFRRLRRGWSEQLAPFDLTPYQFRALQALAGGVAAATGTAEGLRLMTPPGFSLESHEVVLYGRCAECAS